MRVFLYDRNVMKYIVARDGIPPSLATKAATAPGVVPIEPQNGSRIASEASMTTAEADRLIALADVAMRQYDPRKGCCN
jgi:hypothetical protein